MWSGRRRKAWGTMTAGRIVLVAVLALVVVPQRVAPFSVPLGNTVALHAPRRPPCPTARAGGFGGSSACDGCRCGRREEARRGRGRPAARLPAVASLRRALAGTPPRRPRCGWQTTSTPTWTLTLRAPLVCCFLREGQGMGGGSRPGRGRLGRTRRICRPSAPLDPPQGLGCCAPRPRLAPPFPLACPPRPPLGDGARSGEARLRWTQMRLRERGCLCESAGPASVTPGPDTRTHARTHTTHTAHTCPTHSQRIPSTTMRTPKSCTIE